MLGPASVGMAEFVIKLADERGRVQEQVQTAATAEELRARFVHAGYHVFSVRARSGFAGLKRAQGQAGAVPDLQPAVSDADQGGAADSGQLADAGEEPEERAFCRRNWTTFRRG